MLKSTSLVTAVVFAIGALAVGAQAQRWNDGPVVVYENRDGRGNSQGFDVGEYRNDRSQFGSLRNDSAASVYVPDGYRVRFCESENRNGSGRCEEFGEGYHNLRYPGSASYIRVDGRRGGWGNNGGGWSGAGGGRGVTVHDDRNQRGASQTYGPGRYLNSRNGLGAIRNDEASSVVVDRGFFVKLCDSEGQGWGSGQCDKYGEGRHNIRLNDAASYIEVRRGRGWGNNGGWGNNNDGGWGNNNNGGNNNGGWNGGNNGGNWDNRGGVVVFSDSNQRGDEQVYGPGTYRNDRSTLGNVGNDAASSVYVPRGYRVRICDNEAGGSGGGSCEEYGPGSYNLRYNDRMSFIRVWRSGF